MAYKEVSNLEEIIAQACEAVKAEKTNASMNFMHQFRFNAELLKEPRLLDVEELANDWQSVSKPEHLYFSHGEYIGENGIPFITQELREKPDSNRAIISLISQQHILKSGDTPIPSFMLVQFSRIGKALYATVYFRALEVSKFLRINIEEIRQMCEKIRDSSRDITEVCLTIFAFRAYYNPGINTLMVPEIDRLSEVHLLKRLEKSPRDLAELIRDKNKHQTVVTWKSFEYLLNILEDSELNSDLKPHLNNKLLTSLLREIIKYSDQLSNLRKTASHHDDITELGSVLSKKLDELASEFEKWT